jgi:transcriptional regulator with XRE-family HTH domain
METLDFAQELEKLGKRIKQLRKHKNLTLLELEAISGINDSDLSRYEQGKENLEFLTIYKIAKALEVEVYDLTNYEGALPSQTKPKR